ncbi:MAG TPA: hypothetical protein VN181_08190 [Thermoanaerobaculia bacterium]|nr:hypothetical protein [Thermoanaerobaculia bacterium]
MTNLAIWSLRVWITEEAGYFVAQGLEVDYAAQGRTREEAMQLFSEGFARTIDAHLREFESADAFLKPVSAQLLMDFNARKGDSKPIDCVSITLQLQSKATIEFYELPKVA